MRVLVIEDDADIGGFVRNGLTEAGYLVDLVANGEDGLDVLVHRLRSRHYVTIAKYGQRGDDETAATPPPLLRAVTRSLQRLAR